VLGYVEAARDCLHKKTHFQPIKRLLLGVVQCGISAQDADLLKETHKLIGAVALLFSEFSEAIVQYSFLVRLALIVTARCWRRQLRCRF